MHIDTDGTIYDVSLNQTNVGGNNNKFYRIQILEEKSAPGIFYTWTRWGRVGERGKFICCESIVQKPADESKVKASYYVRMAKTSMRLFVSSIRSSKTRRATRGTIGTSQQNRRSIPSSREATSPTRAPRTRTSLRVLARVAARSSPSLMPRTANSNFRSSSSCS